MTRHIALLASLLLLAIVSATTHGLRYGVVFTNIAAAIVLIFGTVAVSSRRILCRIAAVLAVLAATASWVMMFRTDTWILIASYALALVLLAAFSFGILADVLRGGRITAEKIYGAISVYLLLGFAWAFGYAIVELVNPGSFSGLAERGGAEYVDRVIQMRYFSFSTLTTVGYGDIVPKAPLAQTLTNFEAVMGQIYLTVLVARLVGLHIVHFSKQPRET